jgi:hypothetical protein
MDERHGIGAQPDQPRMLRIANRILRLRIEKRCRKIEPKAESLVGHARLRVWEEPGEPGADSEASPSSELYILVSSQEEVERLLTALELRIRAESVDLQDRWRLNAPLKRGDFVQSVLRETVTVEVPGQTECKVRASCLIRLLTRTIRDFDRKRAIQIQAAGNAPSLDADKVSELLDLNTNVEQGCAPDEPPEQKEAPARKRRGRS